MTCRPQIEDHEVSSSRGGTTYCFRTAVAFPSATFAGHFSIFPAQIGERQIGQIIQPRLDGVTPWQARTRQC